MVWKSWVMCFRSYVTPNAFRLKLSLLTQFPGSGVRTLPLFFNSICYCIPQTEHWSVSRIITPSFPFPSLFISSSFFSNPYQIPPVNPGMCWWLRVGHRVAVMGEAFGRQDNGPLKGVYYLNCRRHESVPSQGRRVFTNVIKGLEMYVIFHYVGEPRRNVREIWSCHPNRGVNWPAAKCKWLAEAQDGRKQILLSEAPKGMKPCGYLEF